ncbi:uncharacterized protein LAESUDRAFT_749687 [Laetiporus sulphureus 93-53]|uniref:Uncharacterized protein n=1 Tax=Laetiporus sulphureus 93-53 TaxID=1314785 RepID=A0A165EHM0_9APHY|nr:uncharacterized protein LAESUDRAFT_749687 [Laetiporus sulphureus 93-53]KZT07067.1 hypothetical protein LAESUDRAFT_749687 [Laetiporus sulphureus 93-53]
MPHSQATLPLRVRPAFGKTTAAPRMSLSKFKHSASKSLQMSEGDHKTEEELVATMHMGRSDIDHALGDDRKSESIYIQFIMREKRSPSTRFHEAGQIRWNDRNADRVTQSVKNWRARHSFRIVALLASAQMMHRVCEHEEMKMRTEQCSKLDLDQGRNYVRGEIALIVRECNVDCTNIDDVRRDRFAAKRVCTANRRFRPSDPPRRQVGTRLIRHLNLHLGEPTRSALIGRLRAGRENRMTNY